MRDGMNEKEPDTLKRRGEKLSYRAMESNFE